MSEPLTLFLSKLPAAEPDAARTERIRLECRKRLARQAARAAGGRARASRGSMVRVWQPLIGALGVAYLTEVFVQVLRIYGAL